MNSTQPPLTAYMQAVQKLLRKLSDSLGQLKQPLPIIIFGGAAVHFYTQYRTSYDVDIDFLMKRVPVNHSMSVQFIDDDQPRTVVIDQTYNPTLGPLHEDYVDRAEIFPVDCGENLLVKFAAPVDLAISKLGRFAPHDQQDIQALIDQGLICRQQFEDLARDALSMYIGNPREQEMNLEATLRLFPEYRPNQKPSLP